MTKYRKGDKILIECTVLSESEGSAVVHVQLDSDTGNHLKGSNIFTRAIKGHTPKPIEPAAGQVWAITAHYGPGDRTIYSVIEPAGNKYVVIQGGHTKASAPRVMILEDFLEEFEYVSG